MGAEAVVVRYQPKFQPTPISRYRASLTPIEINDLMNVANGTDSYD